MADTNGSRSGTSRRVTSNDVARRAGVSQSVVSFFLTGARPVSPEARARIRLAIEELGFRPNRLAQSLRTTRSGQIAVAVPFITNPIYGSFASGAQSELASAGYLTLLISTLDVPGQADAYFKMIADSSADGMILFPYPEQVERIAEMREHGVPLVFADRRLPLPGQRHPVDAVLVDNAGGVHAAVSNLLSRGHRRIGMMTTVQPTYGEPRVQGYVSAHGDANVPVDRSLIFRRDGSIEAGFNMARELMTLSPPITALVATTNMQTLGALEALRASPVQANRDLAFVGYDSDNSMLHLPSSIATIRYPAAELGRRTAAMLLERLEHGEADEVKTAILYPSFTLGISEDAADVANPPQ